MTVNAVDLPYMRTRAPIVTMRIHPISDALAGDEAVGPAQTHPRKRRVQAMSR
jgi:hypothetical protein